MASQNKEFTAFPEDINPRELSSETAERIFKEAWQHGGIWYGYNRIIECIHAKHPQWTISDSVRRTLERSHLDDFVPYTVSDTNPNPPDQVKHAFVKMNIRSLQDTFNGLTENPVGLHPLIHMLDSYVLPRNMADLVNEEEDAAHISDFVLYGFEKISTGSPEIDEMYQDMADVLQRLVVSRSLPKNMSPHQYEGLLVRAFFVLTTHYSENLITEPSDDVLEFIDRTESLLIESRKSPAQKILEMARGTWVDVKARIISTGS
jgi:hypothetical protein